VKRPLRIALWLLAAPALLLLAAEVAASFTRAGNAAIYVPDPDLYLVRKPDQHGYTRGNGVWSECHINRHGLRGEDLPDPRPPGERWVLCLGDSFTFGGGLDDDEAWPHRLQELLGAPGASGVRVLNGGALGWETRWQRCYLEVRALPDLGPDVVVLGWNWNDLNVDPDFDTGPQYVRTLLGAEGTWLAPFGGIAVLRESHLFRWFYARARGGDVVPSAAVLQRRFEEYGRAMESAAVDPERRCADARRRRFGDAPPDMGFWESTDTPVWRMVRAELSAMQQACAARGVSFAVAMLPEPTWDGPGAYPPAERLAALLDALGVPWVDVQEDFLRRGPRGDAIGRREDLWQRHDPMHPTAEGQFVQAEAVAALLRERGLVAAAPP
jgi:lysophospholipase L1-like esterase